ncbi:MAG: MBL fold metallo-hydrolase [Euryarchaeota archaeon]|nr:MBL fold metallo-hydrolase [Euryarchaeota archaeon]
MKVSWLGHACFEIVDSRGTRIVIDPFDDTVGYEVPSVEADVVLVSHDHHDHNNVKAIRGDPQVVRSPGKHLAAGIEFRGVSTFHDEERGKLRGRNTIFCFVVDGLRVCHLGDLGHLLGGDDLRSVGEVDVLMIPVGGVYTIDADGAKRVIEQIGPRLVFPMHFRSEEFDVAPVDLFLEGLEVERPGRGVSLTREDLPAAGTGWRVVLLDYEGAPDR